MIKFTQEAINEINDWCLDNLGTVPSDALRVCEWSVQQFAEKMLRPGYWHSLRDLFRVALISQANVENAATLGLPVVRDGDDLVIHASHQVDLTDELVAEVITEATGLYGQMFDSPIPSP